MPTFKFLAAAASGGITGAFVAAGWSSFKDDTLPERAFLFRAFLAGAMFAGLISYWYLFGDGKRDLAQMVKVGGSMVAQVTAPIAASPHSPLESALEWAGLSSGAPTLRIGLPTF